MKREMEIVSIRNMILWNFRLNLPHLADSTRHNFKYLIVYTRKSLLLIYVYRKILRFLLNTHRPQRITHRLLLDTRSKYYVVLLCVADPRILRRILRNMPLLFSLRTDAWVGKSSTDIFLKSELKLLQFPSTSLQKGAQGSHPRPPTSRPALVQNASAQWALWGLSGNGIPLDHLPVGSAPRGKSPLTLRVPCHLQHVCQGSKLRAYKTSTK